MVAPHPPGPESPSSRQVKAIMLSLDLALEQASFVESVSPEAAAAAGVAAAEASMADVAAAREALALDVRLVPTSADTSLALCCCI